MNITDVLSEIQLNEGLFIEGNFKDKKGLIAKAVNTIYDIFSKPVAEELMEAISRTKFKTLPLFSNLRDRVGAYTNGAFTDEIKYNLEKYKDWYNKNPNRVNKKIDKAEERTIGNLDNQKIVVNPSSLRRHGFDTYTLVLIHELIHAAYPYSKNLVKACNDIYRIFKENWNPEADTFYISKVLQGTFKRNPGSSRIPEILPYIISNDIHTEYLTKEGVDKLINYLKTCGVINLEKGRDFWEKKFQKMIEDNKKEIPKLYKKAYNIKNTLKNKTKVLFRNEVED